MEKLPKISYQSVLLVLEETYTKSSTVNIPLIF